MEATAKIQKWGNSQGIRIPKHILDRLGLKDNEDVSLTVTDERLIIAPIKKRKNIVELFADYNGSYQPEEIDWGSPEGNEIW